MPTKTNVTPTKTPIVTRPSQIVTIERYILDQEQSHPEASGDLSGLLYDIALTGKMIAREVRKAGLVDILGQTGTVNIQGEEVQKLDDYANECFIKNFDHSGRLCVMASEEEEDPIYIPDKFECGNYVLLFDPLDGSSNIDANVSVGSIFSMYRRVTDDDSCGTIEDLLRKGSEQVAAGYVLYGSSTMLVYTTGGGQVDGFTLDPSIGEFLLAHADIRIPEKGKIYSCNEGYRNLLFDGTRRFLDYLQENDKDSGATLLGPLRRLHGGRCTQDNAVRRHLHVSGHREGTGRQTTAALRGQPDGHADRGGRRPGIDRQGTHPRAAGHRVAPARAAVHGQQAGRRARHRVRIRSAVRVPRGRP